MAAPKGNKFAEGLTNSGRPRIYQDPDELYDRIVEYFEYIKGEEGEPMMFIDSNGVNQTLPTWIREPEQMTITGLSLFLGFADKSTLYDYAKREEFSHSIKRAIMFVEQHYEEMLLSKAATGAIFALKNFGWKDKKEVDQKMKHEFEGDPFSKIRDNNGIDE